MSVAKMNIQHIGLHGFNVGLVNFSEDGVEWRDRDNNTVKHFDKNDLKGGKWTNFGQKGYLKLLTKDNKSIQLDGFAKSDQERISQFSNTNFGFGIESQELACDGANFGSLEYDDKHISLKSAKGLDYFQLKLDNIANCAIADKNRNEVEIQFHESDTTARDEDGLVQIRFHFPDAQEDTEESLAEAFQAAMEKGMTRSVVGNVIVEFDKEEGTFVNPRGRYGIQMYSTFLRMHGAKYDYKIQYEDIGKLFLLPKPDGVHSAIVICLEKPIRQGNQRYQHLVLQTHMLEHTIIINLSQEEIDAQYEGQLSQEMTMPLGNLFAKVFKVISNSKVFIPKHFKSDRDTFCVKCSLRANDGLLYPLEKSFIFIHKPTVLISFDDIEHIEFQRYKASSSSATRNFDLVIVVKSSSEAASEGKEFNFSAIDRSEYNSLYTFLDSKKIKIKNIDEGPASTSILGKHLDVLGSDDEEDEEDEEDDDYKEEDGNLNEEDDDRSSVSEDSEAGGSVQEEKKKKITQKPKARPTETIKSPVPSAKPAAPGSTSIKTTAPSVAVAGEKRKKSAGEKPVKDKNAPKRGKSSYLYFLDEARVTLKEKYPDKSFGDLARLAADAWKEVTKEEKEKYEKQAEQDRLRYQSEMVDYVPPVDQEDGRGSGDEEAGGSSKKQQKKKKQKKDKNAPKGGLSSYIIFSNEMRQQIKEENPTLSLTDISKSIGAKWRDMTAEDKLPFEEKSKLDKERYKSEMQRYLASASTSKGTNEEKMEVEEDDDAAEDNDDVEADEDAEDDNNSEEND